MSQEKWSSQVLLATQWTSDPRQTSTRWRDYTSDLAWCEADVATDLEFLESTPAGFAFFRTRSRNKKFVKERSGIRSHFIFGSSSSLHGLYKCHI